MCGGGGSGGGTSTVQYTQSPAMQKLLEFVQPLVQKASWMGVNDKPLYSVQGMPTPTATQGKSIVAPTKDWYNSLSPDIMAGVRAPWEQGSKDLTAQLNSMGQLGNEKAGVSGQGGAALADYWNRASKDIGTQAWNMSSPGSMYNEQQRVGDINTKNQYALQLRNEQQGAVTAPWSFIPGMTSAVSNVPQEATQTQTSSGGGKCCFIFIEANGGTLDPVVRRYRDEHMTVRNRRGYCWLADRLVPLMRKSRFAHRSVEYLMTKPMTSYGRYHYGLNRAGKVFAPLAKAWLKVFEVLGNRPPYQRMGTEEVV